MSFPADADGLIASLPTTPVPDVTTGHATHSAIYKQIFAVLRDAVVDVIDSINTVASSVSTLAGTVTSNAGVVTAHIADTSTHGFADGTKLTDSPDASVLHFRALSAADFAALGGIYTPLTVYFEVDP